MIKILNLNIDRWSMLDFVDSSEPQPFHHDIVSTLESISHANIDDVLCDYNDHEYVK